MSPRHPDVSLHSHSISFLQKRVPRPNPVASRTEQNPISLQTSPKTLRRSGPPGVLTSLQRALCKVLSQASRAKRSEPVTSMETRLSLGPPPAKAGAEGGGTRTWKLRAIENSGVFISAWGTVTRGQHPRLAGLSLECGISPPDSQHTERPCVLPPGPRSCPCCCPPAVWSLRATWLGRPGGLADSRHCFLSWDL